MTHMNDFHFLRPLFFTLFIPLALVFLLYMRRRRQMNVWNKVCSKDLLPYLLAKKPASSFWPYIMAFSIGSLLIAASAGPAWQLVSQPLIKRQNGLVIALDLSVAMNAADIKP